MKCSQILQEVKENMANIPVEGINPELLKQILTVFSVKDIDLARKGVKVTVIYIKYGYVTKKEITKLMSIPTFEGILSIKDKSDSYLGVLFNKV